MRLFSILLFTFILFGCKISDKIETISEAPIYYSENVDYHPWYNSKIDSLEKVIYDVAYALKVPYDENNKRYSANVYTNVIRYEDKSTNNPREVYLRFLLNREAVDLTYANMILKQELEKAGGKLVDGIFFANWKNYLVGHKLTFRNRDDSFEYIIRLVYDKSPYSDLEQLQEIAVILTELGNNDKIILNNIDLIKSNNLTLSFLGDGAFSDTLSSIAEANNIETMLTIPLESYPNRQSYYQLNAIKVQNPIDKEQIWDQINQLHNNINSPKGLTHYWGDFASSEADFMQQIIDYCSENNLYYIDAMTTSKSKGFELALRSQILSSWALSYNQVTYENLNSFLQKNSNPVLILPFNSEKDVSQLRKIISLVDRKHFRIVNVSDLLNTDLPKIE